MNLPAAAGDSGDGHSVPGSAGSSAGGRGYPLQHPCLRKPMDRGPWWRDSPWGHREVDTTDHLQKLNRESLSCTSSFDPGWDSHVFLTPPSNFLWHQLGVLQFNSVLTLSIWSSHHTLQVKCSVAQDLPTSPPTHFRCQSQIQVVTVFLTGQP